jgi:hypothetical protein
MTPMPDPTPTAEKVANEIAEKVYGTGYLQRGNRECLENLLLTRVIRPLIARADAAERKLAEAKAKLANRVDLHDRDGKDLLRVSAKLADAERERDELRAVALPLLSPEDLEKLKAALAARPEAT